MSQTQLTIFDQGQMPAHLADFGDAPNIVGKDNTNQLSFRGKVWRVVVEGKEEIVMKDGDPMPSVNVVILDYTKTRARAYFADKFVEGKKQSPKCWSADSKAPDAAVPVADRQSPSCATCPKSAKGSSDSETGKGAACPSFRRAVVVPLADPSFTPLLLRIPQTSLWDKDNKENEGQAFYAFDQYMDFLKTKGVDHTARVVTKLKFDARNSYPKLLFNPVKWTPAEAVPALKKNMEENKDEIAKILAGAYDVTPVSDAAPEPEEFEQAAQTPEAKAAAEAAAKEAQAATAKAAAEAKGSRKPPTGRPATTKPAEPAKAAEPAAAAEPVTIEATATKVVEEAPEPAVAEAPASAGLGSLLSTWDD